MHKALVPADAFNVSVLFGPTLAFLERVKDIMPGGLVTDDEIDAGTGFEGFLDDFVLRTYLPQLEEKVAQVFQQAVGGMDAFQDDPGYKRVSTVPIARVSRESRARCLVRRLTRLVPYRLGCHKSQPAHLIAVLDAPLDTLPSRELLPAYRERHAPILRVLPRPVQGSVAVQSPYIVPRASRR